MEVMRRDLVRRNMLAPVGRDTLDSAPGYFNNEAPAVTVELDRDEIDPLCPLSSKVGQRTFEAALPKRRSKVHI